MPAGIFAAATGKKDMGATASTANNMASRQTAASMNLTKMG
jgi:hypothetical protein